jgi:lysophospholipase L1-like esterase
MAPPHPPRPWAPLAATVSAAGGQLSAERTPVQILEAAHAPVALALLFFGANDACLPDGPSQRQHIPLPAYKANLLSMAHQLQDAGAAHVLLVTPPPVDEAARRRHHEGLYGKASAARDRLDAVTQAYAAACREVRRCLARPAWTQPRHE